MTTNLQRIFRTGCWGNNSRAAVSLRHSSSRLDSTLPFHNSSRNSSSRGINGGDGQDGEEDEELHPNWSGLERRLKSRTPRQRGEGVPEGRTNVKPSEEDFWHKAGVYDYSNTASSTNSAVGGRLAACARLSTVKVATKNLPLVVDLYETSVAPILQVKGFCGAYVFSDRAAGTVQSLTLWESWSDLETAIADSRYAKEMRSLAKLIEAPPDITNTEVVCSIPPAIGGDEPEDVA